MSDNKDWALPDGAEIRGWVVKSKLGEGGFGAVYKVANKDNPDEKAAMKVESSTAEDQVMQMELTILKLLQNAKHICKVYAAGRTPRFNYVVMSLKGKNLSDLKKQCDHKFSLSTAIRVAKQCLEALCELHSVGFVHRDVKPGNFAIGRCRADCRIIYVLDFGLARCFKVKGELRVPRAKANFRGTIRYASLDTHRKLELGPHDDIWSLLYMTVEFIDGTLPWTHISVKELVEKEKAEVKLDKLFHKCPHEFYSFHEKLKRLRYTDWPNYKLFYHIFDNILIRINANEDHPFDWEKEKGNCNAMPANKTKTVTATMQNKPFITESLQQKNQRNEEFVD